MGTRPDRETPLVRCWGCGAMVPDMYGATHRYIGASPGCWQLQGELRVREGEPAYGRLGQLSVDTYAPHQPGWTGRRRGNRWRST